MGWIWAMWVSVGLAAVASVVGLLVMAGVPLFLYDLTPGGYLNGAQTLLLFAIAFYCLRRVSAG